MKKLKYGNTNTYYIDGLLFDTDMPGTLSLLFKELKANNLHVSNLKYVMASHYHPDHMGLISELMDLGVKLVVVKHQLDYIHFSDKILKRQFGYNYRPIDETKALVIDVSESKAFLSSIGIYGNIIKTESHSKDGIALILDDGSCFVGDMEPLSYLQAYDNNEQLRRDWESVMNLNPKIIYSGHVNDKIVD